MHRGASTCWIPPSRRAGGTSHPSTETLVPRAQDPDDTGLNLASPPITDTPHRCESIAFKASYRRRCRDPYLAIPGGMLSNAAAQLLEQNALDRRKKFWIMPRVRKKGLPPLVTPTSQSWHPTTLNVLTANGTKSSARNKNYSGLTGGASPLITTHAPRIVTTTRSDAAPVG